MNLNLNEKPIYALGIYFSYNDKLATEKNFYDKLVSLNKILNIWSSRDISIYGKINIVKTLVMSKLTFVCSVLDTPNGFTEEVNKIIFKFIWKYKQPKIKKSTIIKCKEGGGLNMTDFTVFDKALKLCWVKRLCSTDDATWKAIPNSLLSSVGGTQIFHCNYDAKCINLDKSLPKEQELVNTVPKTKSDVLNQIIWNNQYIKINKKAVFFKDWYQSGVKNVSGLIDEQKKMLPFFSKKNFTWTATFYNITGFYLQYLVLGKNF